ncbi:MAG: LapA family protein [Acidimicrobiales bacterium]
MTDMAAVEAEQVEHARQRRKRLLQALGAVVVVVVVVAFVVENSQSVRVRFWFATAHPRLIWVIIGCLAAGAVLGVVVGRPGRRRRARRRADRERH